MDVCEWAKSTADYSQELVNSGIEGARSGGEAFLHGEPVTPFLSDSAQQALKPAVVGVCLGVLGSYAGSRPKSVGRALAFGLLGGAIGFGAGVAWESRCFTASVAGGAFRNIGKVRDEHWLTRHPIDYA
jgi:hypothetical protein